MNCEMCAGRDGLSLTRCLGVIEGRKGRLDGRCSV